MSTIRAQTLHSSLPAVHHASLWFGVGIVLCKSIPFKCIPKIIYSVRGLVGLVVCLYVCMCVCVMHAFFLCHFNLFAFPTSMSALLPAFTVSYS